MAFQPGLTGSQFPSEDWMVRELKDIRQSVQQLDSRSANSSGMVIDLAGKVGKGELFIVATDAPYNAIPYPRGSSAGGSSTAKIQAAIDQASANYVAGIGPTHVFIPEGEYTLATTTKTTTVMRIGLVDPDPSGGNYYTQTSTSCLQLPAGVSLHGAGVGKTILHRYTTGPSAIIETIDYENGSVTDMSLIGGGVTTNTHGIFMSLSSTAGHSNKNIWFERLEIGQMGNYGIGHQYGSPDNLHYSDLWIHDVGDDGIDHKVRNGTEDYLNNGARGAFFNNILVERHGQNFVDASGLDLRGRCQVSNVSVTGFGRAGVRTFGITMSSGIANVQDKRAATAHSALSNFYIEGIPGFNCSGLQMQTGGPQNVGNGYIRWCTTNGLWVRNSLGAPTQSWRNGPTVSNITVEGSRGGNSFQIDQPKTALSNLKAVSDIQTFDATRGNLVAGQTVFTLWNPMDATTANQVVQLNDVVLVSGTDYTTSGTTLTLTAAVSSGDIFEVINKSVHGIVVAVTDVTLNGYTPD
ncbi:MAG: hypothetical protein M3O29_06075, partial [Actinomycetota bacterium]|nr:hypothetical protein [Actinomycetota bacterium]